MHTSCLVSVAICPGLSPYLSSSQVSSIGMALAYGALGYEFESLQVQYSREIPAAMVDYGLNACFFVLVFVLFCF